MAKLVAAGEKELAAAGAQAQAGEEHGDDGRADLQVRVQHPLTVRPLGPEVHSSIPKGCLVGSADDVPSEAKASDCFTSVDAGLKARSTLQQPATDFHLTRTGLAMGTAGYMSPEQARGEKLDARTDLFSFGLILYEMATGQRAFTGDTAAILKDAILNQTPAPVCDLNSTLPSKLEKTIDKALEKDRELRYQSASEMQADLQRIEEGAQPGRTAPAVGHRWKLLASAAVVILVALIASGLYWRPPHKTATKLTAKDTIVLTDFSNSTGDPIFGGTLKYALIINFKQSPSFNVLSDRKVSETLKRMNHSPAEPLTPDLARQVCLRTQSKALLRGSIADNGNRYVIGLVAMDCQTGDTLASTAVEAENRDRVIHALGEAGTRLRTILGDSSASLEKFNRPLEVETTPLLEAMQAYTQGQESKGAAEALQHLKRAVELDPSFALGHAYVGAYSMVLGRPSLAIPSFKKAYELRDRLSLRHRLWVEANYYMGVTGELEKAIQSFTEIIRTFPETAGRSQLGYTLRLLGRNEQAVAAERESIQFTPTDPYSVSDIMFSYMDLERPGEAQAAFDEARARNVDSEHLRAARYALAFVQGDQGAMSEQLTWAMGRPGFEDLLLSSQSDTEAYHGRLDKARALSQRAVDSAMRADGQETAAGWRAIEALREAELGNAAKARQVVAEALAMSSGRDVLTVAAMTLARAGDFSKSQKLGERLNREFPLDTMVQGYALPAIRATIELQENNPRRSIEILQTSTPYELGSASLPGSAFLPNLFSIYLQGQAYLQAKQGQQAAIEFQKMLNHPSLMGNFITGALAHLQLGRAQAMMGDKDAARKSYQDFLTLWKDADPDIPIFKEAKAEYAKLK